MKQKLEMKKGSAVTPPFNNQPTQTEGMTMLHKDNTTNKTNKSSVSDAQVASVESKPRTTSLLEGLAAARQLKGKKDFVLPGLKRGKVGSLVSPGGTGKSWLALQLATFVASGIDMLGLNNDRIRPLGIGKVSYLTFEDDYLEVLERLDGLLTTFKIPDSEVERFDTNLNIVHSFKIDIMDEGEDFIKRHAKDSRLLIIDTFSNIHSLAENETKDMCNVIDKLNRIAAANNTAILFLHHTSKAAALNGQGDLQQATRGSSALTDNIRYQSYVVGLSKDDFNKYSSSIDGVIDERNYKNYIQYGISKCNHEKIGAPIWLYRSNTGALKPVEITKIKSASNKGGAK